MNEPVDVATAETLAFLTAHLPRGARMIEVGCGEGRVALALQDLGYRVTGLDSDGETVARAKARGAPVTQAIWPEFEAHRSTRSHLRGRCTTLARFTEPCRRRAAR